MPASNCNSPLRPLVIGAPRSGFTLLCSVVIHFVPLRPGKRDIRQRMLGKVVDGLGDSVSRAIVGSLARAGVTRDLIYSPNFRKLTGGPKWLSERDPEEACFRKYIGVRGLGDFSLVTAHPRQILDHDEVLHSHAEPSRWPEHSGYADCTRFASLRSPAGCIVSSCLSINALTSEYIQRFVPADQDNHGMRERLALYKFTDLDFFAGLVSFYRRYLEEFLEVRDRYIVMRWEDLITKPHETIRRLADKAGLDPPQALVEEIWAKLDHRNLTGDHRHNLRPGGGVVGDWMNWATNRHIEVMRDHGFDRLSRDLGYDPPPRLDPERHTPFQRTVAGMIERGEIFTDYDDRDLFRFAFNKSNLDSEKFPFKRYGWRQATKVERADFSDEPLMQTVWGDADAAVLRINRVLERALLCDYRGEAAARRSVAELLEEARDSGFSEEDRDALEAALGEELLQTFHRDRRERAAG